VGQFHQNVRLFGDKAVTVRMLVDTGATYSMISEALARTIGIVRSQRPLTVTLADGRRRKFDGGLVRFSILGREALMTLLIGDVVEPILGMEALEILGLTVEPRQRRLKATRGFALRI
jgi:clan AA aspartic protease